MKKIGVIGAGIMAAGMAQNFLKQGYEVNVWNRTQERLQPLLEAGAVYCDSPAAVTKASDIVIECVSDDEASRQVWTGGDGILAEASQEKVLITSATLSLEWTDELSGICQKRGFQFLDMPLTGSRAGAEGGTLKLLVGGEKAVLESVRHELEAVSDKIYHFGPAGTGMRFKLILNSLIGIHMDATAQAVELARKAGISPESFQQALFDGAMGPASPSANLVLQNLDRGPDFVNFAIKWLEKDLRYAQELARTHGTEFNLLDDAQADYARAVSDGLAERDATAIYELYKEG